MKRIIWSIILALMVTPVFAANQWYQGSGTAPLEGTTRINDIDTASKNYAFDPLNSLLSNYQRGMNLAYASASTITAKAGEIVVADAAGTTKLMLKNASDTTVTWAMIDTGTEAVSTTYYVYAKATTTADTTAGFVISTSATTPTGITYYKRLGSFYNNASGNISLIQSDNNHSEVGDRQTKSSGVVYLALTDGYFACDGYSSGGVRHIEIRTDSSNPPVTVYSSIDTADTTGTYGWVGGIIKKGDYYTCAPLRAGFTFANVYFIPISK